MKQVKQHLFICTNCTYKMPNGDESSNEEAITLRRNLKNKMRESEFKEVVKVSAVSCLGECEKGIAAVFYPEGEWVLECRGSYEKQLEEKLLHKLKMN